MGCQIVSNRVGLPAIILLLPAGFVAGHYLSEMNLEKTFGSAFSPMVGLAVAIILFDGGLDLNFRELEGHSQRVVRRLLYVGIPVTWAGATLLVWPLLGLSSQAAVMLGAIVIVSGPTVVAPVLAADAPGPASLADPRMGRHHDRPHRRHHRRLGFPGARESRTARSRRGDTGIPAEYRDWSPRGGYRYGRAVAALEQVARSAAPWPRRRSWPPW